MESVRGREIKVAKGPWSVSDEWVTFLNVGSGEQVICTIESYSESAKSNANLIACAPEMYEMLESKIDLIRCGIGANYSGDPKENPEYLEVVELLRRARGE